MANIKPLTHDGVTLSRIGWARRTGIPAATIQSRLAAGWDVARALTTPPDRRFAHGGRPKPGAVRPCPKMLHNRSSNRAYARFTENGATRTVSFGPWGSPAATLAYRVFALEWAAGIGRAPTPGITVRELVEPWLRHCEHTYRKRGRITSEVHCNRTAMVPLVELFGDAPAAQFTGPHLLAVREAMIEREWARKTINAHVRRIVRAFGWAAFRGLVPPEIHAALQLVHPLRAGRRTEVPEGAPVLPVPDEHVQAVLAGVHLHADADRRAVLSAMIRVQLLTGMRPGELCALRAGSLEQARTPWRYEVADNKVLHRGIGRVVFFGPRAREALTPLLVGAGPDDPVFRFRPHRPGWLEALTSHRYREFVAAACVSAGVPVWTPNQLRHNRATELMDALEDDAAVAAVLGNSPEVTRRVYAHRAGETAARRIAEATG